MRLIQLISFLMTLLLIFTQHPVQSQSANFNVRLIINGGIPYHKTLSSIIEQSWTPLLVQVQTEGVPQPIYNDQIGDRDFDIAIFNLDQVSSEYPPIWETYSPDSVTGKDFYDLENTAVINNANIDLERLSELTDSYKNAENISSKINLAHEFQQFYNDEVLLDIPLTSQTLSILSWQAFQGFDYEEGVLGSIFRGASWASNPEARADVGRDTSELHYSLREYGGIQIPIYYQTRGDLVMAQTLYSALMKKDKNGGLHPDLAVSYNKTVLEDGGSIWQLNLRDDAFWSDGEKVDAYDVKFTYDLISFNWIGATSNRDWNNLVDIRVKNTTSLEVEFSDNALNNQYKFSTDYIIPEHILNQSSIYEGDLPANSDTWMNFVYDPVTAGPYEYSISESDNNIDAFVLNPDYWYPNEDDSPNHVFDLADGNTSVPYYFNFDDGGKLSIDNLYFHLITLENVDDGSLFTSYVSGQKDIIELDYFVAQNQILNNDDLRLDSLPIDGSGLVLLLNLEKTEFQNYNIRKALYQALNRDDIIQIVGYGQRTQLNPVSVFYSDFYYQTSTIQPSLTAAADTFRQLGYEVIGTDQTDNNFNNPIDQVLERIPVDPFMILLGITVTGILVRNSRKSN